MKRATCVALMQVGSCKRPPQPTVKGTPDNGMLCSLDFITDQQTSRSRAARIQATVNDRSWGASADTTGPSSRWMAAGKCTLYMYGPSADKLFEVVEPILAA